MSVRLPDGFADLEPFVAAWAIAGTAARAARRSRADPKAAQAFFAAAAPRAAAALDWLDRRGFAGFDPRDTALMELMLTLAHVSLAVEVQGPDEVQHTAVRDFMRITTAPADM
jgi:hypothetical protein